MNLDMDHLEAAGEHLDALEAALKADEIANARLSLDSADAAIQAAREQYKTLQGPTQQLFGQLAKPLSQRRKELAARMPSAQSITLGAAEPEQAEDGDLKALEAEAS